MPKTHTIEHVTFGAKGRRWEFVAEKKGKETYRYSTPILRGGLETATKVANVINGAVKRSKTGSMDNLGRSNMAAIFHRATKASSHVFTSIGTYDR